jgi:RNA polymerase sigma-70 factor (ECF subfamily)
MTQPIPVPDQEATQQLVVMLRSGHADAPSMLNKLYRESLLRFCWGYLGDIGAAEDASQEVSYKVITATDIPDHFRAWLYRIARNHCLNMLRDRQNERRDAALPPGSMIGESLTGHLTRLVRDEMKEKVVELVRRLPENLREVLRLRYVEGLSRGEVAQVLDLSEATVKTRLFEGLKRLKELTGGLMDSELRG